MTGLSYTEMEGCRNLLSLLDNDEIMALCDTITNRLVQPEDRQDAIRAILVYSQSVEELLRRRKVHREIIFKYLATQGVVIPPATEKHNLIQHAKDYWKKQLQPKLKETPEPVKTEDIRLSEQLLQQSAAAAPYLGRVTSPDLELGVAPLGPPAPAQPLLLGCGVAPLGHRP